MYISTYPLQKTWWFILKSQDGNSMVRSKDFSPFSSAGNVLNTTNQFTTGRSWRIICVANWGFSLSVTQTIVGHFLNLSYKIMLGRNQPFRKKLILVCGKKMTITPKATIRHVWKKMKGKKKNSYESRNLSRPRHLSPPKQTFRVCFLYFFFPLLFHH